MRRRVVAVLSVVGLLAMAPPSAPAAASGTPVAANEVATPKDWRPSGDILARLERFAVTAAGSPKADAASNSNGSADTDAHTEANDAAGTDAGIDALQRLRTTRQALALTDYTDVCDDAAGSRLDLRTTTIAEDAAAALFLFVVTSCTQWSPGDLGDGLILWPLFVPGGRADGPDYIVAMLRPAASDRVDLLVVRTPSNDDATWTSTHVDPTSSLDSRYARAGVVPAAAIGGATRFGFFVLSADARNRQDSLPEPADPVLGYPQFCSRTTATVTAERGEVSTAVAAARRAGLQVRQVAAEAGTFATDGANPPQLAALRQLPGVAHAEPAVLFSRHAVANDPYYGRQWSRPAIKAPQGWRTRQRSGLALAVIDDGVNGRRKDLAGRVLAGRDTVHGRTLPAGANSDLGGHGTAVAGVAGAAGNNRVDVAGVDWGARIVPYRVFDASGCATDAAVAKAIEHAAKGGIKVINVSLGSPRSSAAVKAAVAYAQRRGSLIVASVGNERRSGNRTMYPAAYAGVIGVGATTRGGAIAPYSNTGTAVDLVAPGGSGSGGFRNDIAILAERNAVSASAGTSFAAPHVAAAALLYRAKRPRATPAKVAQAVTASAVDLGPRGRDRTFGSGLLNLSALLRR